MKLHFLYFKNRYLRMLWMMKWMYSQYLNLSKLCADSLIALAHCIFKEEIMNRVDEFAIMSDKFFANDDSP